MRCQDWVLTFCAAVTIGIALLLSTCSSSQERSVDVSQRMLIETAVVLSEIDRAHQMYLLGVQEARTGTVAVRVLAGDCDDRESVAACAVRLLREEMRHEYELVLALEVAHEALSMWEDANDAWRQTGERPEDWGEMVCIPVTSLGESLLDVLDRLNLEVPPVWSNLLGRVEGVCSLGAGGDG